MLLGSGPETLGRQAPWTTTASLPSEAARMDLGVAIAAWSKQGANAEAYFVCTQCYQGMEGRWRALPKSTIELRTRMFELVSLRTGRRTFNVVEYAMKDASPRRDKSASTTRLSGLATITRRPTEAPHERK
eukprot:scaffold25392_cov72-Phaeocystis_antarctica.AAC.4